MTDSVLKPGEVIRPELDEQMVRTLVRDLYGLTVSRVKELNSYDDRNFWIHASHSNNPCIKQPSEHGYVLKILNLLDSKFTDAMGKYVSFFILQVLLFVKKSNLHNMML